jgi:phosphoribosylaminoimidazole carboxylase (NCAIR synthetase)
VNTVDFLYTCLGHLSDSGFATIVQEDSKPSAAVSAEEIAKVKAEWQEKQKKKQEREKVLTKEKEKEKEEDSTSKQKEELKVPSPPGSLTASQSTTSQPTHDRYILHRDFFAS